MITVSYKTEIKVKAEIKVKKNYVKTRGSAWAKDNTGMCSSNLKKYIKRELDNLADEYKSR
ncbi:hypothetical protein DRH29_03560 [candidate division Kazan bacterium]|uniref:Uncharacterized protein n=1 Tax=candidate division Kazan bacterium TaxID=2202143 RepID=A0A420ZCC3_UNCK3|nr:MAG: hypothetical protein DRH29_03560 [candidate division Kazan bacterium]